MSAVGKQDAQAADIEVMDDYRQLRCHGEWIIGHLAKVETTLKDIINRAANEIKIDMSAVSSFDIAGALLIQKFISFSKKKNKTIEIIGLAERFVTLLKIISKRMDYTYEIKPKFRVPNEFYYVGKWCVDRLTVMVTLFSFIGELLLAFLQVIRHPRFISMRAIGSVFENHCYRAMPIVALLNFLVGLVLTYQMQLELQAYGMNLFIVNISSLIILREFGALITAIIAAGRTSTAFSAQIGTMIINDEIDALRTMGVRPMVLLIVPKVIGVLIALPLLTVWADLFGMFGAMLVAKANAGISFYTFVERFQDVVPLRYFFLGLVKTPVFALIITIVGCFQGFRAEKNANSVGQRTTQSAVQSLFLIIIADALFSILMSWGNV